MSLEIKRAKTYEERGDLETSIAILQNLKVPKREGRLSLCVFHNLTDSLSKVGRYAEAEALLPEARRVALTLGSEIDRVRLFWVAGRVAGGLGRKDEAIRSLSQVRGEFASQGLDYDTALVSLELAALYAEDGRTEEVKSLARHLVPIFQAKRVEAEALKALSLFRQAAEQERATESFISRIVAFLRRARHNPELRFES
jgi:tetratricopeptide (TPR) repeat protein